MYIYIFEAKLLPNDASSRPCCYFVQSVIWYRWNASCRANASKRHRQKIYWQSQLGSNPCPRQSYAVTSDRRVKFIQEFRKHDIRLHIAHRESVYLMSLWIFVTWWSTHEWYSRRNVFIACIQTAQKENTACRGWVSNPRPCSDEYYALHVFPNKVLVSYGTARNLRTKLLARSYKCVF